MTEIQYNEKEKELLKLRKEYKFCVIHEDSATKVNNIKLKIDKFESELKSHNSSKK